MGNERITIDHPVASVSTEATKFSKRNRGRAGMRRAAEGLLSESCQLAQSTVHRSPLESCYQRWGLRKVQDDAVYYRTRAQQEIEAAIAADPTSARQAHLELAQRYEELANALEQCQGRKGVSPGQETGTSG
jgi:hypothetical protein